MANIESLLSKLEQAVGTTDLSTRYQLSRRLQGLARSIATPRQTMQHYGYTYTEQVVARTAADLDLFTLLAQSEDPLKTEEIASKSGAAPPLIDRILRHLASTYTIAEIGPSTFAANEVTRMLASPPGKGNVVIGFNSLNPAFQMLPDFLKETKYRNPDQTLDTAFHRAFDTKMQFFLWMQQGQERIRHFHPSLTAFESTTPWTATVPLAEMLRDADTNAPLFVDVGGGHGYQCAAFRKATAAQFPGRVINQDLPETLAEAPAYEDIEMMPQDFYTENQIKGAKIYYVRHCLHDLPESAALTVLRHIRAAMAPHSILLIDEMVIPDTGASSFAMQMDITMMAIFASTERTVPDWKKLLGDAGLKVRRVWRYDSELEYSILEAMVSND